MTSDDWFTVHYDQESGHGTDWKIEEDGTIRARDWYSLESEHYGFNQKLANLSDGKRWGDGQIAASIPLHQFQAMFGEAEQAGDMKYIKKKLNDPDLAKFRTFKGKL